MRAAGSAPAHHDDEAWARVWRPALHDSLRCRCFVRVGGAVIFRGRAGRLPRGTPLPAAAPAPRDILCAPQPSRSQVALAGAEGSLSGLSAAAARVVRLARSGCHHRARRNCRR